MNDYIDCLLDDLETKLPFLNSLVPGHQARNAEADNATAALWETFSPQQRKLFLFYEETHNALGGMEQRSFARQAFLLARDIFR